MDAERNTGGQGATPLDPQSMDPVELKRIRLLASLTLIAGISLIVGLPFALRAGAEFFLPVTAALVIAIALVPMLEWLEEHGVPSKLAALVCVIAFLALAAFAIASTWLSWWSPQLSVPPFVIDARPAPAQATLRYCGAHATGRASAMRCRTTIPAC